VTLSDSQPSTPLAGLHHQVGAGRPARRRGLLTRTGSRRTASYRARAYPYAFYLPAGIVYLLIFVVPTVLSFFFSLTRWTLFDWEFVGLENFRQFFTEQELRVGLQNTVIYAVVTSGLKVVLGLLLAILLTSRIRSRGFLRSVVFFPVLVSTVAVGITFSVLLAPDDGLLNRVLLAFGVQGPDWLGNPTTALLAVALVDVWKGLGIATVIYIAGVLSIPREYYEAAQVDGAGALRRFWSITVPLSTPATFTVILLSFIGGLRSFDLVWTMTQGGPGFASDVMASIVYKQYQAGFFGLSTAGNVVLFLLVTALVVPMSRYFSRREVEL
jgi:raffinose/stachyose/melibiose transport system permease protein